MVTSVLQIVQDFTDKMGLPTPTALVGSQEKSVKQYRALFLETIRDLQEYRWQQQRIMFTFPAVATQDQGDLFTLIGAQYGGLVSNSIWNDTRHMRVYGPLSDPIWNALQTLPNAGPEYQSWISRNHLYFSPAVKAGDVIRLTYITNWNVKDQTTGLFKERITADSDSIIFPVNVVQRVLDYKWRKQKKEAGWQDDYNDAMGLLSKELVRDGTPTYNMDVVPNQGLSPGIVIPAGSWNVHN